MILKGSVHFKWLFYNSIKDELGNCDKMWKNEYDCVYDKKGKSLWKYISDMMNDISNKFGTYTNELYVDDKSVFSASYDRFSYDRNNQANLDRDFRLYARGFGRFYKLYRDFGNNLPFYTHTDYYHGAMDCRTLRRPEEEWLRQKEISTPG